MSTAMSLSARFPVVMPAGLVEGSYGSFRLVDGGYFENSVVEAAMALAHKVREVMRADGSDTQPCEKAVCRCSPESSAFKCGIRLIALSDYAFYKPEIIAHAA